MGNKKSSDYFLFKQFVVHHKHSSMKVGTDAVLLGALSKVPQKGNILEVGCGSGVISLMLAQKSQAKITALDIHQASVWEARANFKASPWSERLQALMISYQLYAAQGNPIRFDLIVSNPPFFVNDLKSSDEKRNLARHNDQLSYRDFLLASRNFIKEQGHLSLILPSREAQVFIEEARNFGFFLEEEINIFPKPNKESNRKIMLFGNNAQTSLQKKSLCIRENDNSYSQDYRNLTIDYYSSLN
jgi:tRNA1Val (adenine37-N6)-methyltransferase